MDLRERIDDIWLRPLTLVTFPLKSDIQLRHEFESVGAMFP